MQAALVVARTIHFWAVAMLFGGALLALGLRRAEENWAVTTLRAAALVAGVSGLAWFAIVFVSVTDDKAALVDPQAWWAFLSAPFGWPWLLRIFLCVVALGLSTMRAPLASLALGTCLVFDQAWLGHAADGAGSDAALQIGFYWLHVFAGFTWIGALVMLCVLTLRSRRIPSEGLALFSSLGVFVVAALLASGIVDAALRGLTLATMTSTLYGRALMTKVIVFIAMLGLAIFNRTRLRHRERLRSALCVSLYSETLLGLAAIGIAALLGITPPP